MTPIRPETSSAVRVFCGYTIRFLFSITTPHGCRHHYIYGRHNPKYNNATRFSAQLSFVFRFSFFSLFVLSYLSDLTFLAALSVFQYLPNLPNLPNLSYLSVSARFVHFVSPENFVRADSPLRRIFSPKAKREVLLFRNYTLWFETLQTYSVNF